MPSYRALSRNHDFTALWVGQTISQLGGQVSMFVFPLLTYAMTGSVLVAAVAESVHLVGLAGALLPGGVLADRVDRRRVMRGASAAGILLYSSLVVADLTAGIGMAHLLVVAFLTGAAAGIFSPAETSAVRAVVPHDDLPTALSQNQARQHIATLVGAPLGGLLYGLTRWLPFAADAVSFIVSWVLLGRLRTDLSAHKVDGAGGRLPPRAPARQELAEGLRFIAARPFFRVMLAWSALANLTINALFFAAILRLIQSGVDPLHLGLVETAAGACGLLGAVVAPWIVERLPTGRLTIAVSWSFVPLIVPMVLWNQPLVVAAALSVGLLLNPAGNAGVQSYRIAVTPAALIGRVQSSLQLVAMSAMPLAPVLAGTLVTGLGGGPAIAVLGGLTAGVALIPTLSRSVRGIPRPAQWPDTADAPISLLT